MHNSKSWKEREKLRRQKITQLREHYAAALAKLDEVKSASEDKWESVVTEGEKIHKAFVHSFNYFKSQLK